MMDMAIYAAAAPSALTSIVRELTPKASQLAEVWQQRLGYAQAVLDARGIDAATFQRALAALAKHSSLPFQDYPHIQHAINEARHLVEEDAPSDDVLSRTLLVKGEEGNYRALPLP